MLTQPIRRVLATALGIAGALVLLEVLLQVAALGLFWFGTESSIAHASAKGERVVLCVGDSFTFGLHASSPLESYPAILGRMAAQSGTTGVAVINRGVPGQSSRDVLQRLIPDLEQLRPETVLVLVGTNDFTFRPALLEADDLTHVAQPTFAWRLRTWRLLQLLTPRETRADTERLPFLGKWHTDQVECDFSADGFMRLGDQRWAWCSDAEGALQVQLPTGDSLPIEWRMEGSRLLVQCALWDPPLLLERGPMPSAVEGVLRAHVHEIVRRVRAAGARCALLTYPGGPFARPGLNDELRKIAAAEDVDLVDVEQRFAALANSKDLRELYVPDGHCSDLGNAEIADLCWQHMMK